MVRHPLPELHPGGANDANGAAPADPIAARMIIWSEEQQKVKTAKDDEPVFYSWDRDYFFLLICKFVR